MLAYFFCALRQPLYYDEKIKPLSTHKKFKINNLNRIDSIMGLYIFFCSFAVIYLGQPIQPVGIKYVAGERREQKQKKTLRKTWQWRWLLALWLHVTCIHLCRRMYEIINWIKTQYCVRRKKITTSSIKVILCFIRPFYRAWICEWIGKINGNKSVLCCGRLCAFKHSSSTFFFINPFANNNNLVFSCLTVDGISPSVSLLISAFSFFFLPLCSLSLTLHTHSFVLFLQAVSTQLRLLLNCMQSQSIESAWSKRAATQSTATITVWRRNESSNLNK